MASKVTTPAKAYPKSRKAGQKQKGAASEATASGAAMLDQAAVQPGTVKGTEEAEVTAEATAAIHLAVSQGEALVAGLVDKLSVKLEEKFAFLDDLEQSEEGQGASQKVGVGLLGDERKASALLTGIAKMTRLVDSKVPSFFLFSL
jgi:hypothetical protein